MRSEREDKTRLSMSKPLVGATSTFRGHPIVWRDEGWVYADDGSPAGFRARVRPCVKCGLVFDGSTSGQPDPCLGNLPGVDNACCGHGDPASAYIRFTNGVTVVGFEVETKGCRMDEGIPDSIER